MNKKDKTAKQNLMADSNTNKQKASLADAGLPDLPSYEAMARQLQQNGVMTQNDIEALDHMEAFDRAMAMAMAMAMSRPAVVAVESLEEVPHVLQHVRTFTEWKDYIYVGQILQRSTIVLPFPGGQAPVPNVPQLYDLGGPIVTDDELQELFWKQGHPEREERLQDIIDQDYDYVPTFLNHLGIDPHQHRQTVRLIETLGFLGAMVVMPWKLEYNRLRPSQLDHDLEPAILVPAHPSYPSGHATQAHLTAHALIHVTTDPRFHAHIDHVATEIAVNREWAGVHFASDTTAGKDLAAGIWNELQTTPIPRFTALLDSVEAELQGTLP